MQQTRRPRRPANSAGRGSTLGDMVRRFGLSMKDKGARTWFRNRIANQLLHSQAFSSRSGFDIDDYAFGLATHLGVAFSPRAVSAASIVGEGGAMSVYLPTSFWEFLSAVEYLTGAFPAAYASVLSELVEDALVNAPGPLGVRWDKDRFMPSAAPELDGPLGAEPLEWLENAKLNGAARPFDLALRSLIGAENAPPKRREAIKYAYEALEAAAQAVCGNKRDLSGNRESFLSRVEVLPALRSGLDEFIKFANPYRHGQHPEPAPDPSYAWAEGSVYLCGIFLRAASIQMRAPEDAGQAGAEADSTRAPRSRPTRAVKR